jgi:hypothetical protein
MTTTSITSGTDFIGKTLIIGSTALANQNYTRILDFNNNSSGTYLYSMFQGNNQEPWVAFRPIGEEGETRTVYPYSAAINVYYIYVFSFISNIQIKYNIYEYNGASTIVSKGTITTLNTPNTLLQGFTQFWLGRSAYDSNFLYSGRYDKVALYNGDLFALSDANILSTLLTLVTSTQTNIINNNTYTFRPLGTNFLGVVVNILNFNTTTGSNVDISGITLNGSDSSTTIGGYLNIIGSYIEPLHNLNTPNKQWLMYLNTLSSISGDDLTIKPDIRRNLLLEVSGNNNIFIKKGITSYNLTNLITGDASFSNVDVSRNLNPLLTNNSTLGVPGKFWGNAHIRDISVTNISVSGTIIAGGTIPNVIQIIPQIANNTSLGTNTNIWQRAFIRDLSGITSINGTAWPIIGPSGEAGLQGIQGTQGPIVPGATGPIGPELRVNINTTLTDTDISNIRLTTKSRIYQNISGSFNDPTWSAVNGYYGLAKDAYPRLNPLSSGELAVRTWTARAAPANNWDSICWSPELRLFVAVSYGGSNKVMTSPNGINWTGTPSSNETTNQWRYVCWSPELRLFVAVAYTGTNRVMTSPDGTSWTGGESSNEDNAWIGICWSPQLMLFVAVAESGTTNRVMTSPDGTNWTGRESSNETNGWISVCWSPELGLFVAVAQSGTTNRVMTSPDGTTWTGRESSNEDNTWYSICWSGELGLFVAVSPYGSNKVMTSPDGTTWTGTTAPANEENQWFCVCWSPELGLFLAVANSGTNRVMTSSNGTTWTRRLSSNQTSDYWFETSDWFSVCWSRELGIFAATAIGGTNRVMTSSLKGRPPTSYNVFDSSFNRIDENGKWDFSNINVTTMTAGGAPVSSDDRLKHNEIVITNGLEIIEKLTPKFYQKTQVLLDASYNGDLSGQAWTYEAGLIAQEVLQISDLSFVVGGGDYYEQKYIYKSQTPDLSVNFYEPSANNFELSINYYEPSANNYEISYNLIAQAYNLNYNSVFVYGLAAIKELHTKVKAQDSSILDEQLNDLVTRIEALESNNIL